MRRGYILGVGIVVAVALIGLAACTPFGGPGYGQPYGGPGGMMGGGMMGGGGGGMMGGGMMGGGWGNYNPNAKPITIDQAGDAVQGYLKAYYGDRLALTEIMDFAWNYYAGVEEKGTGIHATELLIDKYTGRVSPEMGPNMVWNAKYSPMGGMMGGYRGGLPTANMTVSAAQAKTLAQQYLDTNLPGLTVAEVDTFYGYYTLHTLKDGKIEGMLSVNGYTGAVWYHTWHGPFLGMKMYD